MRALTTGLCFVLMLLTTAFGQKKEFGDSLNKKDYDRLPLFKAEEKDLVLLSGMDLKPYCPTPVDQKGGICFAYAAGYTGRTMLYNISVEETSHPDKNIFSPGSLVLIAKRTGALSNNCKGGSSVALACSNMAQYGIVPQSLLTATCPAKAAFTPNLQQQAAKYKVVTEKLYEQCAAPDVKIKQIKTALSEKTPVMFGLDVPPSFSKRNTNPEGDLWQLTDADKRAIKCSRSVHAMCIVGYDDNRYGGVFEIVNSWGTDWKNGGFTYISYSDLALIARYAVRIKNLGQPL